MCDKKYTNIAIFDANTNLLSRPNLSMPTGLESRKSIIIYTSWYNLLSNSHGTEPHTQRHKQTSCVNC